ncbi:hypothetical protein M885DRAFT_760 [Pelagophyceae sp. CCMP2097]|nr:hypothetical protein M885DRAFT_760 [Pelagophyceae sp. CCMP2097]
MGPAGRAPLPAANASDVILAETTIFVGAVAFAVRDVVAATVVGTAVDISTLAKPLPWTGCRGRRDASRGKPQPRTLSVRRVRFGNYAAAAAAQRSVVERLAEAFPKAPGSALVFINPAGGTGNAEKLYNSEVSPIFAAANVDAVVCVTSRQHEAYDRCRELAASAGAGAVPAVYICVVGGDGTLAEVVKGLVEGCAALPDAGTRLRQSFRLAHIPGGSGNACAASIAHACNDACSARNAAPATLFLETNQSRPRSNRVLEPLGFGAFGFWSLWVLEQGGLEGHLADSETMFGKPLFRRNGPWANHGFQRGGTKVEMLGIPCRNAGNSMSKCPEMLGIPKGPGLFRTLPDADSRAPLEPTTAPSSTRPRPRPVLDPSSTRPRPRPGPVLDPSSTRPRPGPVLDTAPSSTRPRPGPVLAPSSTRPRPRHGPVLDTGRLKRALPNVRRGNACGRRKKRRFRKSR